MRIARYFAVLVALATVGLFLGDLASDPSPLQAILLFVLIAVFGFLLSFLFRPERTPRERPPTPSEPRRREKKPQAVWSGWNAEEAQVARERRRRQRD